MSPDPPELIVVTALRVEGLALRRGAPGNALLRSGAGSQRARRAARRLARHPSRRVAVAGLCGAQDPGLSPGDVVVASRVFAADVAPHETGLAETSRLRGALEAHGLRAHVGPLLSTPRLVHGAEREALRHRGAAGAVAVDMESAWLAEGVGSRPLAVLRVVMDGPRHELLRPATLFNLARGLATLRRLAPVLEAWSDGREGAGRSPGAESAGTRCAALPTAARGL